MGRHRLGFRRSGLAAVLLIAWAGLAEARERVLAEQSGHRLIARETSEGGEALIAAPAGARRAALAADQRFTLVQRLRLDGRPALVVRGWSGGAYCCFRLHVLLATPRGFTLAGSFYAGKNEDARLIPDAGAHWLPDGVFNFWDIGASRANDLAPPIALRLEGGRLRPDAQAMRRPLEEALGEACIRRGAPQLLAPGQGDLAPPGFATLEQALAALPAGRWGQDPRSAESWQPEAEIPRRALCLLYADHGAAALAVMQAWPADQPRREPALRQLRARLLCEGQALAALRAMNPGHPWLEGRCEHEDQDALARLN